MFGDGVDFIFMAKTQRATLMFRSRQGPKTVM